MTKKANGEGSISKYKNRWRGAITIGRNSDGRLKRKYLYGKTKQEVLNKMTEYKYKNNIGLLPKNEQITVSEWFYTWLFEYKKTFCKPSTFERYEGLYRNYIKDSTISNIKLRDLRLNNIQTYYNNLSKNGKPNSTLKSINKPLKNCLNEALKHDFIVKNYCELITLPSVEKNNEVKVFSTEQEKQFIKAVENNRLKALFILDLGTGLRIGELLALRWDDIDLENCELTVSKSLKRVTIIENGIRISKLIEQTPKTKNSIRKVDIPSAIITILQNHKDKQSLEKVKAGNLYTDINLVFSTELGNYIDDRNLRRSYKRILTKANIPYIKFHSLRHTYATRLFENGVPLKTVSELLGHADISVTANIYTHVMKKEKTKAADKINHIFE